MLALQQEKAIAILITASSIVGLQGCGHLGLVSRSSINVAVSLENDQPLTINALAKVKDGFKIFQDELNVFYPGLKIRPVFFTQAELIKSISLRTKAGVGPDLIVASNEQTNALFKLGLAREMPPEAFTYKELAQAKPARINKTQGSITGVPLFSSPQLSCYNVKYISRPLSTLDALANASHRGQLAGFELSFNKLSWSIGAMGALPSFSKAMQGEVLNAEDYKFIEAWVEWLGTLSNSPGQVFYSDTRSLENAFINGQVGWISCLSSEVPYLEEALGSDLAVATLPSGVKAPSPLNQISVVSLGINSNKIQQIDSIRVLRYVLGHPDRISLRLAQMRVLDTNSTTKADNGQENTISVMVSAREQAESVSSDKIVLSSGDPRLGNLNRVIGRYIANEVTSQSATNQLISILQAKR